MVLVILGIMGMLSLMLGETNPLVMTFPGSGAAGSGVWSVRLVPFLGFLVMLAVMFFAFRMMPGLLRFGSCGLKSAYRDTVRMGFSGNR